MASDSGRPRGLGDLPVRFPKKTTVTFEPKQYRDLVNALRTFGVYDEALAALEKNGVKIVLRSDNPDGITNAIAEIQDKLMRSPLYGFASRFPRVAETTDNPAETEGCPIGKFLVDK